MLGRRLNRAWIVTILSAAILTAGGVTSLAQSQSATSGQKVVYNLDPMHASIYFRIQHLGVSYVYGRFNTMSGRIDLASDGKTLAGLKITVKTASVDTGVNKRDEHLRKPDFFDAGQYPQIVFESHSVAPVEGQPDTYTVAGTMTLHGVSKPLTVTLKKVGQAMTPGPDGKERVGFATEFTIKRSDYGMDKMVGPVGDDVDMMVSFEAVKAEAAQP
ncbi:MAG: YceI family protein [Phycisphaeraceae bacterium]|nr:YceI family protein [Phycisphaeraceae bacterium]